MANRRHDGDNDKPYRERQYRYREKNGRTSSVLAFIVHHQEELGEIFSLGKSPIPKASERQSKLSSIEISTVCAICPAIDRNLSFRTKQVNH